MKGGGRGGEVKKKRGGEKLGRKDTQARKQRGRKEEEDASLVQKKIRQKVWFQKSAGQRGKTLEKRREYILTQYLFLKK